MRACRYSQLNLADHLYFVALGEGRVADFVIECGTCGVPQSTDPRKYVTALLEEALSTDVRALAAQTFPALGQVHGARLELEARIAAREALPPPTRKELLLDVPRPRMAHSRSGRAATTEGSPSLRSRAHSRRCGRAATSSKHAS